MVQRIDFYSSLLREIYQDAYNYFGPENWDVHRYGNPEILFKKRILQNLNRILGKRLAVLPVAERNLPDFERIICDYGEGLSVLYENLANQSSRDLLVKVIAYRILGYRKVKLPLNTGDYFTTRQVMHNLIGRQEAIIPGFMDWKLDYFELDSLGFPIRLYYTPLGIHTLFVLKQYEYNKSDKTIKVHYGDYVIDGGGCWGDTALYFAHEAGEAGKVFTFEFVEKNLEILHRNLNLNPAMQQYISIMPHPLWSESDKMLDWDENGPGTSVSLQTGRDSDIVNHPQITTLSIDDLLSRYKVPRIDFIKLDIEGAEYEALRGAISTIRRYRPRLAVCLYHHLDDFLRIPAFILSLDLGYRLFLDHFSIYDEETILFADAE